MPGQAGYYSAKYMTDMMENGLAGPQSMCTKVFSWKKHISQ
jgi:hypothetical protein